MRHSLLFLLVILITITSCGQKSQSNNITYNVTMSDKEWKEKLSPEQYRVLRRRGTESPFTGQYWDNKKKGTKYVFIKYQTYCKYFRHHILVVNVLVFDCVCFPLFTHF